MYTRARQTRTYTYIHTNTHILYTLTFGLGYARMLARASTRDTADLYTEDTRTDRQTDRQTGKQADDSSATFIFSTYFYTFRIRRNDRLFLARLATAMCARARAYFLPLSPFTGSSSASLRFPLPSFSTFHRAFSYSLETLPFPSFPSFFFFSFLVWLDQRLRHGSSNAEARFETTRREKRKG